MFECYEEVIATCFFVIFDTLACIGLRYLASLVDYSACVQLLFLQKRKMRHYLTVQANHGFASIW